MNWYEFPNTSLDINELIERADAGDLGASAKLSLMYLNGYGVERNLGNGVHLLERSSKDTYSINMCYKTAAKHDDPGGFYGLFVMYKNGWGGAQR